MLVERLLRIALLGSTWVLYLLLVLSAVSVAAMLERWMFFRRHHDDEEILRRKLEDALLTGDPDGQAERADDVLAKSPAIEAKVLRAALRWRSGGRAAVSDAVESELGRAKKELERGLTLLGTLGNNTPFVGLFGTVLGVIEAFHHLADGQNKAAMGNVMAGIAEALIATGVGIFVAIPAVVAYNVAAKKIGDIESNVQSLSKLLTAWIETRERGGRVHEAQAKAAVVTQSREALTEATEVAAAE